MPFWSRTPKERVYSGFMGDTSPEQDQVAAHFKEWIMATGIADLEALHFDDHDILRFCRARKFDIQQIQIMFTNFINWRREQEIDNIITEYDFHERP